MKILKEGFLPPDSIIQLRGKCNNCGCIFNTDVLDAEILPYARSNPVFVRICPTVGCKKLITLKMHGGPNLDYIDND